MSLDEGELFVVGRSVVQKVPSMALVEGDLLVTRMRTNRLRQWAPRMQPTELASQLERRRP